MTIQSEISFKARCEHIVLGITSALWEMWCRDTTAGTAQTSVWFNRMMLFY